MAKKSTKSRPSPKTPNDPRSQAVYLQTTIGKALAETLAEMREENKVSRDEAALILQTAFNSIEDTLRSYTGKRTKLRIKGDSVTFNASDLKFQAHLQNATIRGDAGVAKSEETEIVARDVP